MEALNEDAMKLATKVYEEAAKEQQANQTEETNDDSKEKVVDADYEEK